MKNAIVESNGNPYFVGYDENINEIDKKIDAIIIGGGRDIHPKFYNEEITNAIIKNEEEIIKRFEI